MRFVLLILLFLSASVEIEAQNLRVESMRHIQNNMAARSNRKDDSNGKPGALLQIYTPLEIEKIKGNYIGSDRPEKKGESEKWLWLTEGSKDVDLIFKNQPPLSIRFEDYGINAVEGNEVYKIIIIDLEKKESKNTSTSDVISDSEGKDVNFMVKPVNAVVSIDGKEYLTDSKGHLTIKLRYGPHSFWVSSEGYHASEKESFFLGEKEMYRVVELVEKTGSIDVTCNTTGAEIYLDNERKGKTNWKAKKIKVGTYLLTAKKDGFESISQKVSIEEGIEKKIIIPQLQKSIRINADDRSTQRTDVATAPNSKPVSDSQIAQRQSFTVKGVSLNMVRVDGGSFQMGATSEQGSDADNDEKPVHQVTLSSFYIGETEVTQELWEVVMGSNPSKFKGAKKPVEQVTWNDSQEFIKKLRQLTGRNFRLPTEAEWEYAARGGNKSCGYKYAGSNNIKDVAWYTETTNDKGTHDVKTKQANELGLYDMSGNVWEWCQDLYGNYSSDSQTNPTGASSGSLCVIRGGGWFHFARRCRVSDRSYCARGFPFVYLGLRLAL